MLDLPAPFGPRNPVTRPAAALKVTESTATFAPYRFVTSRISIMPVLASAGKSSSYGAASRRGCVSSESRPSAGIVQQPRLVRAHRELGAVGDVELAEQPLQVCPDRGQAQVQLVGDPLV